MTWRFVIVHKSQVKTTVYSRAVVQLFIINYYIA